MLRRHSLRLRLEASNPPNEESLQYSDSDIRALSEFVATLLQLMALYLLQQAIMQPKYFY